MEEAVNQEEEEGVIKQGLEQEQPTIPTILPGEDDLTIQMSLTSGPPLRERVEQDVNFMMAVRKGYMQDSMFRKIIENPKHHRGFIIRDGLILTRNRQTIRGGGLHSKNDGQMTVVARDSIGAWTLYGGAFRSTSHIRIY
ncbi:hypothetical protein JAAARDRAFT_200212 [Jaapia argillacea MUCL 33604]|uniref:Uncharacterized protein n=1 Tax=Jaapia argillacea MUCL 33604 TaxID=933084 RepID=A0A067P5R9_9AGAM|nr:hypothetical protein JAAARDRAFT_200212 [Jaapia argillacea MUCL 33604]